MPTGEPKGLDKDLKCMRCNSADVAFPVPNRTNRGSVHHVYECRKCSSTQSFVTPMRFQTNQSAAARFDCCVISLSWGIEDSN